MRSRLFSSTLAVAVAVALSATLVAQDRGGGGGGRGGGRGGGFGLVPMFLETDAYADGGIIPDKYAGVGGSTIPGFKITGAPMTAVSYAVIFHDIEPTVGNPPNDVLHALFWNVPASSNGWSEGPPDGSKMPAGTVMGINMTKKPVYMGPGAPAGPRYHHYIFEVYALSSNLEIPPDSTREAFFAALAGKVVAKAAYVGRFRGQPK